MSQTYSDVDASGDPAEAAAWQERVSTWPAVRAYKRRTHELLADAKRIVDVGCGTGVDVSELGADRCLSVDPSATMATAAMARGAIVCRADGHHLPFATDSFDGARADRVFQHLAEPLRALEETIRVVAAGGRVVIADPDQATLTIRVPGVRQSVLDRLEALRRDIGYRNGTLIAQMPDLLEQRGVRDITADTFPLSLTDPVDAFGLPRWPEVWRDKGRFTDDEILEWNEAMGDGTLDGFLYTVSFLVVSGIKT